MHAHHGAHLPPLGRDLGMAQLTGTAALAHPVGGSLGLAILGGDADVAAEADDVAEAQFG